MNESNDHRNHAHDGDSRFRLFVESVRDYAIFMLDPDGRIESWNAGAERIKGYSASEIIGKHFSVFYPPEDVKAGKPDYELTVAASEGRFEDDGWRIRKGGSKFWANVVITAIRDSQGNLLGFGKVTRDLTARRASEEERIRLIRAEEEAKRSELKLRETEERFRLLVDSVKDYAIFMLDPGGHIASWNRGAERIKGYAAGDVIGKHFSIFYPQQDIDAGKCEKELELATSEGRFEDEGWRVRKDGSTFWANVVITAVRDGRGNLVGFAKVTRDLTARVQAEEERIRLARAEEGDRRKEELLAIMSHELRNPLAPMVTAVHLIKLRRGIKCDKEIAILERQVSNMMRLLDDLLDLSRTLRDKVHLKPSVMEIGEVLANAIDIASPLIEQRRHHLRLEVPAAPLLVDVDLARMTQVFANLLNNAAKYTEQGGEIRVRAVGYDDEVDVIIEDTGIGIPAELMPRLFELFTQGKNGLDRQLGGLGIGLAVAKQLVGAHGGEIRAESEGMGRGSRFTVRLPRAAAVTAIERAGHPTPALRAPPVRRRVLIVDDNEDSTELMSMLLKELGHETRVAFDGPHALEVAHEFKPQIAFLDVGLPGMNGYELARRLRQIPACASIPIVAISGYAREGDRQDAMKAGFSAHFAKPIDLQCLEQMVQDFQKGEGGS
jgi:PAS domain S-box-containing protein